ncbi:uncharacterized protein MEPE_02243 [Melanopsichium pennsylvanicum]|uniref:Uncharacterized protein n=2 Tax=Melanopsichium pennsylvanicum TaxID=63383 RepID=A0AAJ5C4B9_9BASI|nr:conserved hypothetical protein [Melanopsichium pennsylvanicum 4]SNX83536.1 uncharacterized protein MEPE_02243 [Melanopsichium pennsylvanicum]
MSAAQLLRASSSELHALPRAYRSVLAGRHYRSLQASATSLRQGSLSSTFESSMRPGTGSSSNKSNASTPAVRITPPPPPRSKHSTSGIPRHHQAKVEVIPFRISTKAAKNYLTTLATTEILPRVMSQWQLLKHQLLSFIGFGSEFNDNEEIVKLQRMTALYLPIWMVDASFEIKCRGNDGRAEANFILTSSRFPGHTWKPMDSMPMFPPPPFDMKATQDLQKDPSLGSHTPKEAWDNLGMVDYESYESHLKQKADSNLHIKGGIPDPVPFSISPLFLPDMLREKLELKDATFAPDLSAGFKLPGSDTHGLGLTIQLVNEDGEQLTSPSVRFEVDTLKLDMFAVYPVLMPLHMAEFSYVDPEDEQSYFVTVVLGAWDPSGLQFCLKEKDQDWQWSFTKTDPLKIDRLDLYPRTPTKTSLNERFEKERQEERLRRRKKLAKEEQEDQDGDSKPKKRKTLKEWEQEWDKEDAEHQKSFQADLKSRIMEKLSSELPIKAAVEQKSLELLQKADWIHWERDEREAFETRTSSTDPTKEFLMPEEIKRLQNATSLARKHPTEPRPFAWLDAKADRQAEIDHPDRKAGLGKYIHWTSPHVQRLSHNVYANRRYLTEAIPDVLNSRKRMAAIVEGGHDVDRSHIKAKREDGTKVSGDEAYETFAAHDINIRQQREALKPRWLKVLEEAGRSQ